MRATPPFGVVGDSFVARAGLADELWRALVARVPDGNWEALPRCGFVMLKPDCFVRRVHLAVWERLLTAGATPLHVGMVTPDPGRWERLYQYNLSTLNTQNMVGSWWLTARVLEAGPSVVALLMLPDDSVGSAEQLRTIKGPSDPYLTSPGQIRHDLRASNVAMNLMHSSDDPLLAAHEFLLFAGSAQLQNALDVAAGIAPPEWPPARATELLETVAALYPSYDADPVSALVGLKRRVRNLAPLSVRQATEPFYSSYTDVVGAEGGPTARWLAFREASDGELGALLECDDQVTALLALLAKPDSWSGSALVEISDRLRLLGLRYDGWERLVVDTTVHFANCLPQPRAVPTCAG